MEDTGLPTYLRDAQVNTNFLCYFKYFNATKLVDGQGQLFSSIILFVFYFSMCVGFTYLGRYN